MNAMMEASRHRIAEAKAADRSINIIIIIIYYSIELKLTVLCSVTHSLLDPAYRAFDVYFPTFYHR